MDSYPIRHSEIFDESGALRSSVFSNVLGEVRFVTGIEGPYFLNHNPQSFVTLAFQAARKADPTAVYVSLLPLKAAMFKPNHA